MRAFVCFLLILVLWTQQAYAELKYIQRGGSPNLIVFIHGFMGSAEASFAGGDKSWPQMIAADAQAMKKGPPLKDYGVAVVDYPGGVLDSLRLEDIAERVRVDLIDAWAFDDYENIHIIAHSMGGLVTKRMLTKIFNRNQRQLSKIKSIFLISVPSQGAPAANFLALLPKLGATPLPRDLETIDTNTFLLSLENTWQEIMRQRSGGLPNIYCAYERKSTMGLDVVPQVYTATTCDNTPRAENENHISIVKPGSKQASMYTWVRGRIAETNQHIDLATLGRGGGGTYSEALNQALKSGDAATINASIKEGLTSSEGSDRAAALGAWLARNKNLTVFFKLPKKLSAKVETVGRDQAANDYRIRGLLFLQDRTGGILQFEHDLKPNDRTSSVWALIPTELRQDAGTLKVSYDGLQFSAKLMLGYDKTHCSFDLGLEATALSGTGTCTQAGGNGFVPFPVSIELAAIIHEGGETGWRA